MPKSGPPGGARGPGARRAAPLPAHGPLPASMGACLSAGGEGQHGTKRLCVRHLLSSAAPWWWSDSQD